MGKKITISVTNDLSTDQRMQKTCNTLVNAGYTIQIIGRKFPAKIPLKNERYQQKRVKYFFNKGALFYVELNIRLFFILLFNKADAYVSVDLDTLLPNYYASKIRNIKLIHDAHEWFSEVPELENRNSVKSVWQWIEKTYYPKLKNAYTVSEGIQQEFKKLYNTHFEVIKNVPLIEKGENKDNKKEDILLYQGAINKGRGLELLLEAAPKINAKIMLIGNGDLDIKINKLIIEKGLEQKVEKINAVSPMELKIYTQKASLGYNVLTHESKSYYYSLPNKFFDYLHAGVPSINSLYPTIKSIVDKYDIGICVNSKPEELAYTINLLLSDKKKLDSMRDNCRKAVKDFNWGQEELKLLNIYKKAFE